MEFEKEERKEVEEVGAKGDGEIWECRYWEGENDIAFAITAVTPCYTILAAASPL